jgi:hypothetical protein
MAFNFLRGDRDQPFLLPPDLRDWLPDAHLAWFILDVVTSSTWSRSCAPTGLMGTAILPTTPRPCLGAAVRRAVLPPG